MATQLIFNPPSAAKAEQLANQAPKPKKFQTTPHVRTACGEAMRNADHWVLMINYLNGGDITGSARADLYELARQLVSWESDASRNSLANALEDGDIKLVEVVKRIVPTLREFKLELDKGVLLGTKLATAVTAESAAA
jgi:hypothetical protein